MQHFICAFEAIKFGIPAEITGQIIQLSRMQNSVCETTDTDSEVYISLPALFRKASTTPHGMVLKIKLSEEKKIILLTPQIEKDMDIPDNYVHGLPKVFSGPFTFFKGVFFDDKNPVFIVDPEKLKGLIK